MLNKFLKYFRSKTVLFALLIVGCAGMERDCSSCNASSFGSDWVVVQLDLNGRPFRCWALRGTSITNETNSDGIYWQSPEGNLIHISGLYNRVQVVGRNWEAAYRELGLTEGSCREVANTLVTVSNDSGRP